jgi:hypothetical protein
MAKNKTDEYWFTTRGEEIETAVGRIKGGWAYEMRVQQQNGRWVIAELRVFPDSDDLEVQRLFRQTRVAIKTGSPDAAGDSARQLAHLCQKGLQPPQVPRGGLTTRHLRAVPFGNRSPLGFFADMDRITLSLRDILLRKKAAIQAEKAGMKELKRLTGEVRLAWIARCYVEAQRRGSRKPNADVARQLRLSMPHVRDSILRARRKRLLSDTDKQGRPGGELTPKAIKILESLERVQADPQHAAILSEAMARERPIWEKNKSGRRARTSVTRD